MPKITSNCILPAWFDTSVGKQLLEQQQAALESLIPDQFYGTGLQFSYTKQRVVEGLNIERMVYCDTASCESPSPDQLVAAPEALPFSENSIDLAVMSHTLDYCDDPHRALREISQVMRPEGVLVLTGFHPYSLWGARHALSKKRPPYDARFISRSQVQDWLALLGFQICAGAMVNYQFPLLGAKWSDRLAVMEKMGDRWWPTLGAVYVLVVKKKVYGGLAVRPNKPYAAKWFPELKPAQARVAHRFKVG